MKTNKNQIVEKAYKYNDYLIAYAKKFTKNTEDAKDIIQNVYLQLMQRNGVDIDNLREKEFCGYLRTMVYTEWAEMNRVYGRETEELPIHVSQSNSNNKESKEYADAVLSKALKAVPERVRDIFVMYVHGLNAAQILTRKNNYGSEDAIRRYLRMYMPIVQKSTKAALKLSL